ncbi:MAG TPA: ATP-binding protein [Anaerolineae bacterium]|nr:ATP-binding protein [Anaerolineae bacterium]HMR64767.1 ATP-binding protein [Anaerolineae bacterium]
MIPQSTRVVELRIPSELGYEKIAREAVATVAHRLNFTEEKIEDIKTAISEACTNAIRYGSGSDARMKIVVILTADENKLDILIKDPGASGAPPSNIDIPDISGMVEGKHRLGGMGLYIIRELVDEAGFIETADEDDGNQFRMVIYRVDDSSLDSNSDASAV